MARLKWGEGPRWFDQGLDHGVLYLDETGVAWNGLVSVEERDTAEVDTDFYFDGNKLAVTEKIGDFASRISAYTYPDIFSEYNGYGPREEYKRFNLSYRVQHGDDHRIHLVYNALIRDDNRSWKTLGANVDPSLFSWNIYTSVVPIPGGSPGSHLILEEPKDPDVLEAIEDILYGDDEHDPRMPDPDELIELYESVTQLRIIYNGDGTYTAIGPDDMVRLLDNGRFELTAPSVFLLEQDIFVVHSY